MTSLKGRLIAIRRVLIFVTRKRPRWLPSCSGHRRETLGLLCSSAVHLVIFFCHSVPRWLIHSLIYTCYSFTLLALPLHHFIFSDAHDLHAAFLNTCKVGQDAGMRAFPSFLSTCSSSHPYPPPTNNFTGWIEPQYIFQRLTSHLLFSVKFKAKSSPAELCHFHLGHIQVICLIFCHEGTKTCNHKSNVSRKGSGEQEGIRFKRNSFLLHKLKSISHKLKQRACHRAVWPPASTTVTVCTGTESIQKLTEIWSKNKNTGMTVTHKGECTGLAVVCGCLCYVFHTTFIDVCTSVCTSNSYFTWNLPDWAKIHVQKPGTYICCFAWQRWCTSYCLIESNELHESQSMEIGL